MAKPKFGKTNFKNLVRDMNDDIQLINKMLSKLNEERVSDASRFKAVSEIALALSRISQSLDGVEGMGVEVSGLLDELADLRERFAQGSAQAGKKRTESDQWRIDALRQADDLINNLQSNEPD